MQEVQSIHHQEVHYIDYDVLANPQIQEISEAIIQMGFDSKDWVVQFQTITKLRQANRHVSMIFLKELLPKFHKNIIEQMDNLRSNNSKEALILVAEIFSHQSLEEISSEIIRPIVSLLFAKSVCEKGFLRAEALKAINEIPQGWNAGILEELMCQTKSHNGQISEQAIKIMRQMLEKNNFQNLDDKFLKELSQNINGKRSVVQKQARKILNNLKKQIGEEKLQHLIDEASELDADESNTLKRELKKDMEVASKSGSSFRQFMKKKKSQLNASN